MLPPGLFVRGRNYYSLHKKDGKWTRKSVGSDLSQALRSHASLRGDSPSPSSSPTFQTLCAFYLSRLQAYGTSSSIKQSEWVCKWWGQVLPGSLDKIDSGSIQSVIERFSKALAPASINTRLRVLIAVFNTEYSKKVFVPPAIKLVRAPKWKSVQLLSPTDLKMLLSSAEGWVRGLLLLSIHTGCRTSELLHLRWEDLNPETGQVLIRPHGKEWTTKSGSARTIYVPQEILSALSQSHPIWVFASRRGKPRDIAAVNRKVKAVFIKAGVYRKGEATIHRLRKSYASHLLAHGIDLVTLRELLGHASVATTEIYARSTDARKQTAGTVMKSLL